MVHSSNSSFLDDKGSSSIQGKPQLHASSNQSELHETLSQEKLEKDEEEKKKVEEEEEGKWQKGAGGGKEGEVWEEEQQLQLKQYKEMRSEK